MLKRKGLYVALGAVGALVILLGTVGMAYAQGPQPPVDGHPFFGDGPRGSGHQMGGRWGWGMRGSSLVDATAEVTGLTVEDVIAALQEGQTFAQIAEEAGMAPQAIVDAFLTDREAALDDAVADGRLTQEQADQMLEEMAERISERLEQPWTPHPSKRGQMDGRGGMRGSSLVDATAEVTGLTVEDVIAALQEGQTFAQIAEEAGMAPQAIVDAFLTDREAALDDAVADGRLTQEQADQMLEEMAEHASEHLEQPWTPRSSDHDRMGQGHSGHRSRPGTGFAPRFSPNR